MTKKDIPAVLFALCAYVFVWWFAISLLLSAMTQVKDKCGEVDIYLLKTDIFCDINYLQE